jgi:predicted DNA binding CopG/RHH family protein
MKNKPKTIPKIKTEDDERNFWAKHSPLDYFNIQEARPVSFPHLKPSMRSISIRLPEDMLVALKKQANRQDVPYQSLAKVYLARQIRQEDHPAIRKRQHTIKAA